MSNSQSIPRHKTAIRRHDFSLPVKCLLRDGLLTSDEAMFDYGCGHGENIERLEEIGINCSGWDPSFSPDTPLVQSEVVNIGYVINVIEDPVERMETLKRAWGLCTEVLVVAAQIEVAGRGKTHVEFGDGIVTQRGTFQKYFTQTELRDYIEDVLQTDAVSPAAIGVFYVFRDEAKYQQYQSSRYRRRTAPRKRISEVKFEEHRELLEVFIEAISDLGRLPESDEFEAYKHLIDIFGSTKRALTLIKRVIGTEEWDTVRRERSEDLLVYLALSKFRRRPPIGKLPIRLQRDIRALFGSYTRACKEADSLLFSTGDEALIDAACKDSPIGKLLPNALYIHRNALGRLSPILRVYEGCARAMIGDVEDANIIKLHRHSGKVSYLVYPEFETEPHPALMRSVKVKLRSLELDCYDYYQSENPPILHRKETFLTEDDPLYSKFARLTRQEEKQGLLEDSRGIGNRQAWESRVGEAGFKFKGHRLVKK